MYIEILSSTGFPEMKKVQILFHEGILHNKRFSIPGSLLTRLIWGKKIPITSGNIIDIMRNADSYTALKDPGVDKFFKALQEAAK
jgi:hypothetical protein